MASAAQAEQLRANYISAIIAEKYDGTSKVQGFIHSFETMIRLHDSAGLLEHRQPMDEDLKRNLLIAVLREPSPSPVKGIDGRKFIGPRAWVIEQPTDDIDTYVKLIAKLQEKFGDRTEDITAEIVLGQLRLARQEGKSVDNYIVMFEDTRDWVKPNELAKVVTHYNLVEMFVSGLDPSLFKAFLLEEKDWRKASWEELKKKVRVVEVRLKVGEDPVVSEHRKKYASGNNSKSDDVDLAARPHRLQTAKYQQEKADLQRQINELIERERQYMETQKKLAADSKKNLKSEPAATQPSNNSRASSRFG